MKSYAFVQFRYIHFLFLGIELDHEIEVESVVIIVFVTLITVLLFFTGIYFYYVRGGKQKFDAFITEHKRLVPKFGNNGASSTGSSSSLSSIRDRLPSWLSTACQLLART